MKSIKTFVVASILATVSFGSFADTLGTVTATGNTLDGLESALSDKVAAAGASSYKIIEAGGQNHLHGTAVLYK